jgi:hypothetical protein
MSHAAAIRVEVALTIAYTCWDTSPEGTLLYVSSNSDATGSDIGAVADIIWSYQLR